MSDFSGLPPKSSRPFWERWALWVLLLVGFLAVLVVVAILVELYALTQGAGSGIG